MKHLLASTRRVAPWTLVALIVAFVLVFATTGAAENSTSADVAQANPYRRILFLGNSITLHGPAPAIGWTGNWGMAASALEKDFVHRILNALTEESGTEPQSMIKNVAEFERGYTTYDIDAKLKDAFEFKPDLVIVAIGENVPAPNSDEANRQFQASVTQLLKKLKASGSPTIVVRSCFWPNSVKDPILKQACQEVNGVFVDISSLGGDESNFARSEREFAHRGVAAHPGDKGMQAIADAILKSLDEVQNK